MFRCAALLFLFSLAASAQVITTVAGTTWLPPQSGVSASGAGLGGPSGVALDSAGNLYIADSADNVIERVSPSGAVTIAAGNGKAAYAGDGGAAAAASLNRPWSVAVDSAGNLYIADSGNNRVRKVANGMITTFAGNGAADFGGDGQSPRSAAFNSPLGVAVDSSGAVYVADTGNNRVRKIQGNSVTTVAGTGAYNFGGDGGPATNAALANPEGIAVDLAGNLYIADSYNCRVRKVTNGIITTVAGSANYGYGGDGGPAVNALLYVPLAVTVDANNNLYIADTGNYVIRKVTAGVISTYAGNPNVSAGNGNGSAANAFIDNVYGLVADASGNLLIAQYYEGLIRKISGGTIATVAGNGLGGYGGDSGPAVAAFLDYPTRVAVDAAGNIYVADTDNNRIRKISNGMVTTFAGTGAAGFAGDGGPAANAELNRPWGIALDAAGNLYIADNNNQRVRKVSGGIINTIAGTGTQGSSGGSNPLTISLSNPIAVAVDAAGNIYIADGSNNRILKITGNVATVVAGNGKQGFSGDGGSATSATLNGPYDIALDSAGNLYIADSGNNVIRRVSGGVITTVAGNGNAGGSGDGGAATAASLSDPNGVAVDARGNLYIADSLNSRVRRVSGGQITTVAGSGSQLYGGDGGTASAAGINFPEGIAFDSAGNLYIADSGNNRVRSVLATTVSIQTSPSSLSFSAPAGGAAPSPQNVNVNSAVTGVGYAVSASAPWITVSNNTGAAPGVVQIGIDPTNLAAGSFNGRVTISSPVASPSSATITISAVIAATQPPSMSVTPSMVSLSAPQGGSPVTQTFQVLNTGGGSLSFGVGSTAGSPWMSFSAPVTTATPNSSATISITADPSNLAPGTYNGSLAVTGAGAAIIVPVTFSVSPPTGTLQLSQTALTFNAVAQGGAPLPSAFSIVNTGQGVIDWTASAATLSGGNWLQISTTSGSVQRPFLDSSTITASVSPSGLAPGTYYGRIQISSTGAVNTPQSVTVILNVLAAGTKLGPQVYPTGLIFTGVAGQSPSSQDITVANPSSSSNSYVSSSIGAVSSLPANAVVLPNQPTTVHVYPDFTNLGPGVSQGTITLQFNDGSPAQTVNVLMSVAPASAGGLTAKAASCQSSVQVVFLQPQGMINAAVGQSVTLEAKVSDGCGNVLAPGTDQVTIAVAASNGDSIPPMTFGNGVWQTSWTAQRVTASVAVGVTATVRVGNSVLGGNAKVYGSVSASPTPLVSTVFHAASSASGAPIAPGELIAIKGANLATGSMTNLNLPLPSSSNGTQVLLGTQPLPILYSSAGQMNVQVPFTVPINTTYQLTVQNGNALSAPQTIVIAPVQPGIFTTNEQGFGQADIFHADDVTLAQPGTPAAIGDVVVIYCTGLGAVTPAVDAGQGAPSTPPLSTVVNPVTVTIGGKNAQILFAGLTPGAPGVYQINAVVPSGVQPGDAVPVIINSAGQFSPGGVTMSIH